MKAHKLIRGTHRWVSVFFTLTVAVNFVVMTQGEPPAWVTYSPLLPLLLLMLSGLYLFVLPYTVRVRSGAPEGSNGDEESARS